MPDDDRDLKRFLDEAHRALDPSPPSFAETLAEARRRAGDRRASRAPRPVAWWAVPAVAAALVLALVGLLVFAPRSQPALGSAEALRLAEALATWHGPAGHGPTDFLGRPPGAELIETLPRLHRPTLLPRSGAFAGAKEELP